MSYPQNDPDWREYAVTKVEGDHERGWGVTFDSGWCFHIPSESPVEPCIGMTCRQYGRGLGSVVRGCFLDGQQVFYRTEAEEEARHAEWCAAQERSEREKFEREQPDLDRRVDALPPIFRARIDKFRRNNPEFRWKYESYELFVCEQAVVIADALKTPQALREWHDLKSWEAQKSEVPALSGDHSGNTFGAACRLAMDYLEAPENVEKRHGALAPLVGSEEYGCVPRESSK